MTAYLNNRTVYFLIYESININVKNNTKWSVDDDLHSERPSTSTMLILTKVKFPKNPIILIKVNEIMRSNGTVRSIFEKTHRSNTLINTLP